MHCLLGPAASMVVQADRLTACCVAHLIYISGLTGVLMGIDDA